MVTYNLQHTRSALKKHYDARQYAPFLQSGDGASLEHRYKTIFPT